MYKLSMPILNENDKKGAAIIDRIIPLLKEVFGFTDIELDKLIADHFGCDVVKDLTLEQLILVLQPFFDHSLDYFNLLDNNTDEPIWLWNVYNFEKQTPKSHYYDEPVVRRDQLVDPFAPKAIPQRSSAVTTPVNNRPVVECPYCHSTNTEKISTVSKGVAAALFGVFSLSRNSKQWHCNDCKSDF